MYDWTVSGTYTIVRSIFGKCFIEQRLGIDLFLGTQAAGKAPMNILRWAFRRLKFLVVFAACGAASVFIMASSYETAFGKDLPYINAVNPVDLSFVAPIPTGILVQGGITAKQTDSKYEGTYGAPSIFKSSKSAARVAIAPPLQTGTAWLARASTAHYLVTSPAKGANIGDLLIYMRGGATTIADPTSLTSTDNIFIDTKRGWRYLYRVDEAIAVGNNITYVMAKSAKPRLYTIVETADKQHFVVAATLINVQNGSQ